MLVSFVIIAKMMHLYAILIVLVNILETSDTVTVNNGQFQVNIVNGTNKCGAPFG